MCTKYVCSPTAYYSDIRLYDRLQAKVISKSLIIFSEFTLKLKISNYSGWNIKVHIVFMVYDIIYRDHQRGRSA